MLQRGRGSGSVRSGGGRGAAPDERGKAYFYATQGWIIHLEARFDREMAFWGLDKMSFYITP